MNGIVEIIEELKSDWSEPKIAIHVGKPVAVPLVCRFEVPADTTDLPGTSSILVLPPELLSFWRCTNGASLFVDETYGQWGLHLWSAHRSAVETKKFAINRAQDFRHGDVVLGEFLGDSDLLLVRCDPGADDYGSIIIALPLDYRADWDRAALSLEAFLRLYAESHGEKFWKSSTGIRS